MPVVHLQGAVYCFGEFAVASELGELIVLHRSDVTTSAGRFCFWRTISAAGSVQMPHTGSRFVFFGNFFRYVAFPSSDFGK